VLTVSAVRLILCLSCTRLFILYCTDVIHVAPASLENLNLNSDATEGTACIISNSYLLKDESIPVVNSIVADALAVCLSINSRYPISLDVNAAACIFGAPLAPSVIAIGLSRHLVASVVVMGDSGSISLSAITL